MKPVIGLPKRRSPHNIQSSPSGQKSSGWDRFNNKHTPEEIKFYRDKWNEFYPDDPLISQPKYQKTSTETQKEYLRRMWNVVFPDDQIDWDNFKPRPIPDLWIRFYSDFASEEEMYRQDQEQDDGNTKYTPEQEMELWYQYYEVKTDDWGNSLDDDPHPLRTKSLYNRY